jgi:hypothetical protein
MTNQCMYQYPVEECDVRDLDSLRQLRVKRAEWITWLRGDDPHSIWRQITALLWNDVLFRTVNDLRRIALEKPNGGVGFNDAVLRLFDAGFVTTQVTTIRRLTDRQPKEPTKGVISLRRLVADIRNHRHLLTRDLYVSYDGLPYDPAPARDAWIDKKAAAGTLNGVECLTTTGPTAWGTSQMVHENFDKLSERGPAKRSRDDLIATQWFGWLDSRLDLCDDIRKYTDKFVAHAAEPSSRAGLTQEQTGVTLDRLRLCQKAIYQVAAFVYGPLLWEGSYGAVPIPQYDHLENLEKGWIAKDSLEAAHEHWNRNLDAIEKWESEALWPEASDGDAQPPASETLGT